MHVLIAVALAVDPVYMPSMTTTEVREAIDSGHRTVLIPTGGIEQNGPWLTLDKHDRIAREVAERTARELGDALVAPVVSFVPEGDWRPASGHMQHAGTVSVSDETFEALLTDVARSYRAHGFETIAFLGDSGGNQKGQEAVATRLDRLWPNVRVLQVDAFYDPDANNAFLEERGITWTPDAHHDDPGFTLQLLAVDPVAARVDARRAAGEMTTDGFDLEPIGDRQALGDALLDQRAVWTADSIRAQRAASGDGWGPPLVEVATKPAHALVDAGNRLFIGYLVSSLFIAFGVVAWRQGRDWSLSSVARELFPAEVWLSRDAFADLVWSLCGGIFAFSALMGVGALTRAPVEAFMAEILGALPSPGLEANALTIGLATLFSLLFADLSAYLAHLAQHRIPVLWIFHKTHHAARHLTPLTVFRQHPVDLLGAGLVNGFLLAFFTTTWTWATGEAPRQLLFFGANTLLVLFYFGGYHLRHSHVWLTFGPLDRVFVSPAMHQIHHSEERRHWDTNMGLVFSVWDQLFGTAYIPEEEEELSFGIGPDSERFRTAWDFFWQPIREFLGWVSPPDPEWDDEGALRSVGSSSPD